MENNFGRKYHFNFEFWHDPHRYGFVNLHQVGEVQCEPSYEVSEHTQLCSEITCVISGEGECYINGRPHKIKADDVFVSRVGDKHKIIATGEKGLHFFYIGFTLNDDPSRDELVRFYNEPHSESKSVSSNNFLSVFSLLISEFYFRPDYSDDYITSLLQQIIIMIYRKFSVQNARRMMPEKSESVAVGATVYSIIKYIDNNLENLDSIRKISSDLGYSYNYFSRMFKEKTGVTLRDYIYQKKVERSVKLIESGRFSLTRIAIMLDYDTVQSFSKAFKRTYNMSPSEYRARYFNSQKTGEVEKNEEN